MCILFVYTDPSPSPKGYRLILASNRDESYKRPARQAFECVDTGVIAGRDMEPGRENGSWLGMATRPVSGYKYRFGALLNVTGEQKTSTKGRGFIVVDYLEGAIRIEDYQQQLHVDDEVYTAYNFVSIDLGEKINIGHTTNVNGQKDTRFQGKQILGFGNSTVTTPLQKVLAGKELFKGIVSKLNDTNQKDQLTNELIGLLKEKTRYLPDPELEKRSPNWYESLSQIYVEMVPEKYGTRTHTVILVDHNWNLEFKELTMEEPINASNPVWDETTILKSI